MAGEGLADWRDGLTPRDGARLDGLAGLEDLRMGLTPRLWGLDDGRELGARRVAVVVVVWVAGILGAEALAAAAAALALFAAAA